MLLSMTGYGEAAYEDARIRVGFRAKSVNNRGLDLNFKLPVELMYLDGELRECVKSHVMRGRVDIYQEIEIRDTTAMPPTPLHGSRVRQWLEVARQLREDFGVPGEVDINTFMRLPDLAQTQRVGFHLPEELDALILSTFSRAMTALVESRQREGSALAQSILEQLDMIEFEVDHLAEIADQRRCELREQILKRVRAMVEDLEIDEHRLHQEIVFQADRLDCSEEFTRLKTHIPAMRALILSGKRAPGKELEFMIQEQQREVTTIGNKARHPELADTVVRLKTEYEKIREQTLNLE